MTKTLMKTHVARWGNSLALRLPKVYAEQLEIKDNTEVDIHVENNKLVITMQDETLESLLEKVQPEQIHKETDFGTPEGKEIW